MSFLTNYWKPLAGIVLILVIFLFGYYQGYSNQKKEFDAFVLQTELVASIQQEKNKQLLVSQKKVTENTTKEYKDAIKKLSAYNATNRVHNTKASGSTVSVTSKTSSTTNGETKGDLSSTINDCSLDVLQLLYLQDWLKKQEIVND